MVLCRVLAQAPASALDQDKLRIVKPVDDLCFVHVPSNKAKMRILNANFAPKAQKYRCAMSALQSSISDACTNTSDGDTLCVMPTKHAAMLLYDTKKDTLQVGAGGATKRGSVGPGAGRGSSPSTPTMRRGTVTGGTTAAAQPEETPGLLGWSLKWSSKEGKAQKKVKTYMWLHKGLLLMAASEKGAPVVVSGGFLIHALSTDVFKAAKDVLPLDLYNVERPQPGQLDLVPTGAGFTLAKPRNAICLQFDNPQLADKWHEEITKTTEKGAPPFLVWWWALTCLSRHDEPSVWRAPVVLHGPRRGAAAGVHGLCALSVPPLGHTRPVPQAWRRR